MGSRREWTGTLPRHVTGFEGYLDPPVLCGFEVRGVLVLIGEAGLGKSYVSTLLSHEFEREGKGVRRCLLAAAEAEYACKRVTRICRDVLAKAEEQRPALVIFDGIAAGDEHQCQREAHSLERLADAGVGVVVCLRPEGEPLVEALSNPCVVRQDDLRFRSVQPAHADWDLTGGVPQLVAALHTDRRRGATSTTGGERYADALEELVSQLLREHLSDEEFRLRLAAMLLGSGTLEELDAVSGRCDRETLFLLEREVPLLGVSARKDAFSCYGLSREQVFVRCLSVFQGAATREPSVVIRACGLLASRGDALRSVEVCKLSSSEQDFATLALQRGVSYVTMGELGVVHEAVRVARRLGLSGGTRQVLCEAVLAEVTGSSREVDKARAALASCPIGESDRDIMERVMIMGACRDLCRDPRLAARSIAARSQEVTSAVSLAHVRAFRLLLAGDFTQAYVSLATESLLRDPVSLPDALLCNDLFVALVMSGGMPDARERALVAGAERVFARMGATRGRSYGTAIAQALQILMGGGTDGAIVEAAAARAERMGDALVRALFLVVLGVRDLRVRGLARAHVRASQAASIARTLGAEYLAAAADLVDALCLSLMGETGALGRYCADGSRPDGLLQLAGIAAHAAGEVDERSVFATLPPGSPCPTDTLWMLFVLMNDCGALSDAICREVPASWLERARCVRTRQAELFGANDEDEARRRMPSEAGSARGISASGLSVGTQAELLPVQGQQSSVFVRAFGSLAISVDGTTLPSEALDRRCARELVLLLALAPGHRMQRYRAAELLWPDIAYGHEPRRMYEATSEARRRIMDAGLSRNPIISDRAQGTVGFDRELVSCDVDEFEREARLALEEEHDDFWVLDHARQMMRLYAGGPDPHVVEFGAEALARVHELEVLFVDATVAAAEAALRLGKGRMSVRFASDARRVAPLREDAMIVLVYALKATGRAYEVKALFADFRRRLFAEQGAEASLVLRQAVERAVGEDPEVARIPVRF